MNADQSHDRKLFTVAQANATLPLVSAIAKDLSELAREVVDRRERLSLLMSDHRDQNDLYGQELDQIRDELEKDGSRLQDFVQELIELGTEPKDPIQGLVDFPCLLDGRVIYLCWRLGEPELLYWHELDSGFSGRKPLNSHEIVDGKPAEHTLN